VSPSLFDLIRSHPRIVKTAPDGRLVAWCPFHPDGEGKPPHEPNLLVSEHGFICHACGAKGNLKMLAGALGISLEDTSVVTGTVYDYRDKNGQLRYQVVRKPGKKFLQRRPDGKGGWIWNLKGTRPVPYRLQDLIKRPDDRVFVPEGEKDADRLASIGLLATTNSGGAGKWKKHLSRYFNGRNLVILPDNDDIGRSHAEKVARSLSGSTSSIKILNLPGLRQKGDVSDWLRDGGTAEELSRLADETPLWEPAAETQEDEDDSSPSKTSERDSIAKSLVSLLMDSGIELFRDQRGEPFARTDTPDGRRIFRVESKPFRHKLQHLAWTEMERAPSSETLRAAISIVASIARFEGHTHPLHNRCAHRDGAIWIDLDGVRAVAVGPSSWEIVRDPPILFRPRSSMRPLPEPKRGGALPPVLRFLNLPHAERETLYLGYLVCCLVPDIPVPALVLAGPQGAAKTTLLRVTKRILDPSGAETRGSVKDPSEYAVAASQTRVLYFDNLTHIPDGLSDAFCRTVTGDGFTKRTLYTDEDETVLEFRCVIGFSGINIAAERADLLDRSLILELESIPQDRRREEATFWAEYEKAMPSIFGGLLDTLAAAMDIYPRVSPPKLPRMADAARWGAAAAEALGLRADDFLQAFSRNVQRQTEAAIEGSLVAQAVIAFMGEREEWAGPATLLLSQLQEVAKKIHIDQRSKDWPGSANVLSRKLREASATLARIGIDFERRKSGDREILLWKRPGNTVQTVRTVQTDRDGEYSPIATDDTSDDIVQETVPRRASVVSLFGPEDDSGDMDGISGTMRRRSS
jgi:hypothetical protein